MTAIQEINFQVPKFGVETKEGSKHYPDKIKDWFSVDFDNYFVFQHPIILDLDLIDSGKSVVEETSDLHNTYSRPKHNKQITFQEFVKTYYPNTEKKYLTFGNFLTDNIQAEKDRPSFLFGSEEGSGTLTEDLRPVIELLDPLMTEDVYVHYDGCRFFKINFASIPAKYLCKTNELFQLAESFKGLAPEFILAKNNAWCLTTLYDDCISAIGCNNEIAERLRNKTEQDIHELNRDTSPNEK